MLKDQDKIFKNLYNKYGSNLEDSLKRDDWLNTKDLLSKYLKCFSMDVFFSQWKNFH